MVHESIFITVRKGRMESIQHSVSPHALSLLVGPVPISNGSLSFKISHCHPKSPTPVSFMSQDKMNPDTQ